MIHAQTVRPDQLDKMIELNIRPSFFTNHVYYFGDYHYSTTLGPTRANNIDPTGWATEKGMHFTIHTDAPVTPIVPNGNFFMVWVAVNRLTSSNRTLG